MAEQVIRIGEEIEEPRTSLKGLKFTLFYPTVNAILGMGEPDVHLFPYENGLIAIAGDPGIMMHAIYVPEDVYEVTIPENLELGVIEDTNDGQRNLKQAQESKVALRFNTKDAYAFFKHAFRTTPKVVFEVISDSFMKIYSEEDPLLSIKIPLLSLEEAESEDESIYKYTRLIVKPVVVSQKIYHNLPFYVANFETTNFNVFIPSKNTKVVIVMKREGDRVHSLIKTYLSGGTVAKMSAHGDVGVMNNKEFAHEIHKIVLTRSKVESALKKIISPFFDLIVVEVPNPDSVLNNCIFVFNSDIENDESGMTAMPPTKLMTVVTASIYSSEEIEPIDLTPQFDELEN